MATFNFDETTFNNNDLGYPEAKGKYPSFLRAYKVTGDGADMKVALFLGMEKKLSTPVNINMSSVAWLLASFFAATGNRVSGNTKIDVLLEDIFKSRTPVRVDYTPGVEDEDGRWATWPRFKFFKASGNDAKAVEALIAEEKDGGGSNAAANDEEIPF